ncbi:hypothetical protein CHLNCDRAFT_57043 [Chlorella variabilis]|uniref:Ubiquinol-cytochrome c chaperone domain-containing protein n=1 Tax=Chlorella variabilis TaxID=554065 RepID=E1Z7L1_CHLVA|nr:hypothetical protein CHLNCDRAFT_57043 [Chlorella variabilis]EFN58190.1 hypothetical protein CHLNCDRAFT_57043 [Chlorella variabilis]|eukprot:XP_005850292.1 hypothetical protein CHLNCDRAFT_57043 [Chlorella variabilis]
MIRALSKQLAPWGPAVAALEQRLVGCSALLAPQIGSTSQQWQAPAAALQQTAWMSTDAFKKHVHNAGPRSLQFQRQPAKEMVEEEQRGFTFKALLTLGGYYSRESRHMRAAQRLYTAVTEQAVAPAFLQAMGIPEEFQQMHSSICLHIWLLLVRLRAEGKDGKHLAQLLYDDFQTDVEDRTRKAGVRVRLQKQLTELEKQFYGSSMAYDRAMAGQEALDKALLRNVYLQDAWKADDAQLLARYVRRMGTKPKTPGGLARGGSGSGRSGKKRIVVAGSALSKISTRSWKRLARRAGVLRMSKQCFDPQEGIGSALEDFLRRFLRRCIPVVEYARRFTVTPNDVAFSLKQMGITLYVEGADWTYGSYTRSYVRRRVMVRLPEQLLIEAAAHRAESEVASAQGGAEGAAPASVERAAAAAREEDDDEQVEAASAARRADQAEQEQAQVVADGAEGMEVVVAAAAAEQEKEQAGDKGKGEPVAAAGERRLSGVPTPGNLPMSKERAQEVQGWIADVMHGPLSMQGYVNRKELRTVVLAKHSCTVGEVQDVLFSLERAKAIMVEGDDLYLCSA